MDLSGYFYYHALFRYNLPLLLGKETGRKSILETIWCSLRRLESKQCCRPALHAAVHSTPHVVCPASVLLARIHLVIAGFPVLLPDYIRKLLGGLQTFHFEEVTRAGADERDH